MEITLVAMWGESIRRTLENLERYESLKNEISRWFGGKIYEFLNYLEALSTRGLFLRRFLRWLRQQKADKESSENETVEVGTGKVFKVAGPRETFLDAFNRRFFPYLKIFLIFAAMLSADFYLDSIIAPSFYVTIFNVVGSLMLARGVIQARWGLIQDPTPTGSLQDQLVAESHASVDAIWGAFFLLIGFILHILFFVTFVSPL